MRKPSMPMEMGGDGVERYSARSVEVYGQAIDKGQVDAMVNLGAVLSKGAEG